MKMPVYRSENGTFYSQCFYRDGRGAKRHKVKRGFATELEALMWEKDFLAVHNGTMDMLFADFVDVYAAEIKPIDVVRWQNQLIDHKDANGKPYSATYLRTINNQLNAIFNHAERYYDLMGNPCRKVTKMGSKKGGEMNFWTKQEYLKFSEAIMDKPLSFYAFEVLYWTGIRCGELLALTPSDFLFETSELSITKSYQRLKGIDTITEPKTPNSVRRIAMPKFLTEEMKEYLEEFRGDLGPHDRIFDVSKYYLTHEIERGCKESGVKRIRVHDLRHSHVSLLIEMGFSALAIADRVGHESTDITYRYAHLFPNKQTEIANALDCSKEG